ncbi:hypothetical protein MAPG_11473 [Magnaporthiopsis poae ATCC 64411]|uniref:NACHT domain-containing protein n=1 Tax=Magnaporthiopsis poae (strain ATCC 64411 / 73-15) TaxID=644358 RepID=A0A0C4EFD0_MAGP6|nr:hypothetical protein MAPG_11473 [Magnaporthiopsis poae ATCC 64411]
MADPLSIAASIGGIIALADVVYVRLKKIGKYVKKVKHAADDIETLAAEVGLISGTLHRLSLLAQALEGETIDPTLRMEHIQGCHRVLAKIERLVTKALEDLEGPSTLDALQRKLKWPFSNSAVGDLIGELSIHKDSITLALSADTMNGLLASLAMTAKIECSVNEIATELGDMRRITTRIQEDSERRKILAFFEKVNPQKYYDASLALRHPLTGLWLLELPEFKDWLSEPASKLWLRGIPGAGKTVLAGNMIEKALRRSSINSAVAFFFCDYRDSETLEVVNILGALVSQLARQSDAAYQLLEAYYSHLHPAAGLPKRPSVDGLKPLLADMAALYGNTYVIVDGLDECGKQLRSVIQALLPEAGSQQTMSVAILSRDEADIRRTIGDRFVELEILAHSEDLAQYVSAQIAERLQTSRLRFNDPSLKNEIGDALIKGAGGMFRWVACQLDHLEECHSDSECRKALTRLPPGLPETYARILQRINKMHTQRVEMSLNFIAYSHPRLTLPQLREILSIPDTGVFEPADVVHEEAISGPCSSLVRKLPDGSAFVFAHKSVQDFLEDEGYLDEHRLGSFKISRQRCAFLLTKQLLRFLTLPNFNTRIPSTVNDHYNHLGESRRRYSLLYYAETFWPDYSRGLWNNQDILSLGLKLFGRLKTPNFIRWAFGWLSFFLDRKQMIKIFPILLHRDFRPLHMAAVVALEELCESLLEHTRADLTSPAGTPIQCAIAGLRSFTRGQGPHPIGSINFDHQWRYESPLALHGESPNSWVPNTIRCLAAHDPDFAKAPFQRQGESCLASAFITARLLKNFGIVCEVLDAGALPEDDEMATYQDSLDSLDNCLPEHRSVLEQDIQRLVQALQEQIDDHPASLCLCSIVWNKAFQWGLPFSFDPMNVSSQISMNEEALERLAFNAVQSSDPDLLQYVLKDPRADLPRMRDNSRCRDTLLHAVFRGPAKSDDMDIGQQQTLLLKLVHEGCDLLAVNRYNQTPLHLWAWPASDESKTTVFDEAVSMFVAAGFDPRSVNCFMDNIYHHYAASYSPDEHLVRLKAILEGFPPERVGQALFQVNRMRETPLTLAIKKGLVDTAVLMLSHYRPSEHAQAAREKLVSAALDLGSASVMQRLVELDAEAFCGENAHPLHRIKALASIRWVQVLKSVAPLECETRVDGRLPVEVYLRSCFEEATAPNPDVLKELGPKSAAEKALVWEFYASAVTRRPGPNVLNTCDCGRKAAESAGVHLTHLGYSSAFEIERSAPAAQPILCPFGQDAMVLWLFIKSTELISLLVDNTQHWASVVADGPMSHTLLLGAFVYHHQDLLPELLEKGLSLQATRQDLTTLETICEVFSKNEEETRRAFDVVFEHLGDYPLNRPNPANGLTLLHRVWGSGLPWLVEQLLDRGADPNVRSGDKYGDTPLMRHLRKGSLETFQTLLRRGADPTIEDAFGYNAILAASCTGRSLFLEELESFKTDAWTLDWNCRAAFNVANAVDTPHCNGYQMACARGHLDVLAFFETHGLIPDPVHMATTPGRYTPLHLAAGGGGARTIKHLIAQGASLNARDENNYTPLHWAIWSDDLDAVCTLLASGASPGRPFGLAEPLTLAYQKGNSKIIAQLQEAINLDPARAINLDSRKMAEALEAAILNGDLRRCQELVENGCPVDTNLACGGCSPLLSALRVDKYLIARWLLSKGASATKLACLQHGGVSALEASLSKHALSDPTLYRIIAAKFWEQGGEIFNPSLINAAITSRNREGLEILLDEMEIYRNKQSRERGSSIRDCRNIWTMMESSPISDEWIELPLLFAIDHACTWAVDLLLEHGAGLDMSRKGYLQHCLIAAAAPQRVNMVADSKDFFSRILGLVGSGYATSLALRWACSRRPSQMSNEESIDQLLQHGADLSMPGITGRTAVSCAAYAGRTQTFARLVQAGADPHHVENSGISAMYDAMHDPHFTSMLLNGDFAIETSRPLRWDLAIANTGTFGMLWAQKLYRKRLSAQDLERIFNLNPTTGWSPLCLICGEVVSPKSKLALGHLLDLGARIDHDGCPYGSALMLACSANKVCFAKLLVRRGAALMVRRRDGTSVSALEASRPYPELVDYLLFGRFMDQAKISAAPPPAAEGTGGGGQSSGKQPNLVLRPWSGPIKASYIPAADVQRRPHESSRMHLEKLHKFRIWARGKVVTLDGQGRQHEGAV